MLLNAHCILAEWILSVNLQAAIAVGHGSVATFRGSDAWLVAHNHSVLVRLIRRWLVQFVEVALRIYEGVSVALTRHCILSSKHLWMNRATCCLRRCLLIVMVDAICRF